MSTSQSASAEAESQIKSVEYYETKSGRVLDTREEAIVEQMKENIEGLMYDRYGNFGLSKEEFFEFLDEHGTQIRSYIDLRFAFLYGKK